MKIKKILINILLILTLSPCLCLATDSESSETIVVETNMLNLYSEATILIDADTGTCLYSKNPNTKMYPASTTKIMTAILVIENGNLDDTVTTSSQAISGIPARILNK